MTQTRFIRERLHNMSDTTNAVENQVEAPASDPVLKEIADLKAMVKKAAEPKAPEAPAIRKGESILSSRPISVVHMMRAVMKEKAGESDWADNAKIELELAAKVRKETDAMCNGSSGYSKFCMPIGSAFMPRSWADVGGTQTDGTALGMPGYSRALIKEIQDHYSVPLAFDPDEAVRLGVRKDQLRNDATLGGTMVPLAAQGEMIEVLRNSLALGRVPGVRMVPLPPQGSIRFPRQTSVASVAAYGEGATISETSVNTGAVVLSAKRYSGLMDMSDEIIRFAGNPSIEGWCRQELAEQLAITPDADMLTGPGGLSILGLLNIPSIQTKTASTAGDNGNTLHPEDITTLIAQMAGANAHVDRGVAVLMRPELLSLIGTSRDDNNTFAFGAAFNNTAQGSTLWGYPVTTSTNISNTRRKGSGTALTYVLVVVPSEIMVGTTGVMDFAMTDSDASKFQQGIKTVRAMTYLDMGVRHESGVGLIDTVLNTAVGP
jgi:HK97 family phage major capsid protein